MGRTDAWSKQIGKRIRNEKMPEKYKVVCECGWHGWNHELLTARHPFVEADEITGCPLCKGVSETASHRPLILTACDEPNCWESVTCGTPIKGKYRSTCSNHRPER